MHKFPYFISRYVIRNSPAAKGLLAICLATNILLLQGCPAVIFGAAGGTALAVHDRRDSQTILQDEKFESVATDKIYEDPKLKKKIHANVTSYNKIVLVTGEVLSSDLREYAISIVQGIPGIKRIHNELKVADLTPFSSRSKDSWITSKVKAQMVSAKGLDATRVKVVTEKQTVYLMGLVTEKEADIAANVARNVKDVIQVVKIFEIIPEPAEPTPQPAVKK